MHLSSSYLHGLQQAVGSKLSIRPADANVMNHPRTSIAIRLPHWAARADARDDCTAGSNSAIKMTMTIDAGRA